MSKSTNNAVDKKRRRWFYLGVLLILLLLILVGVYVSPIGQAWRQSRDMATLQAGGLRVIESDSGGLSPSRAFLLRFLPRNGILQPISAVSTRGLSAPTLELASRYTGWQELELELDDPSHDALLNSAIENWTELRSLSLEGNFTHDAIPSLTNHRNLTKLQIDSPNCGPSIVPRILAAPQLEQLDLYVDISDEGVAQLLLSPTLERLNLGGAVSLTSQPFLHQSSTSIQSLLVGGTRFDDAGFQAVLQWPELRKLYCYGPNITDGAFASVAPEGHSLEELGLGHTAVTNSSIPTIALFENLRVLDLLGTTITDANIESLNRLGKLEMLFLPAGAATDSGTQKLQLSELKVLLLSGRNVSLAELEALPDRLPNIELIVIPDYGLPLDEQTSLQVKCPNVRWQFELRAE